MEYECITEHTWLSRISKSWGLKEFVSETSSSELYTVSVIVLGASLYDTLGLFLLQSQIRGDQIC